MLARVARAARWGVPVGVLAVAVATLNGPAQAGDTLADVRAATVRFHSVKQANKAGYLDNELPCFDQGGNGMGEHLINGALLDDGGALDAEHPEALVYEVRPHGNWKLVAVEYVVLYDDAPADGPAPTLLGQEFTQHPTLPLWKLHAWVFRSNPLGVFQDYNPDVGVCP